jgi:hypothetical protein
MLYELLRRQSRSASHAVAGNPMGVAEVRWKVVRIAVLAQFAGAYAHDASTKKAVGENRNDTKMWTVQFRE